ncbi:protein phosphatase 1 regulatory subunit 7 [Plakobranchus ocellatus]|uniref:Protein phosphatase 1 regulatory subunit 7 n=1 Tax=Plakobranchus ocellatus TaxID=259542 RepID=A0AAV4A8J5_9GAST|nr:protein phosphatase 1 regulatory subunit 7 [Plakobranchus ocellatus]
MSDLLSEGFIEHHITSLPLGLVPESWGLERIGQFYQLDLKMCQIKTLDYSFHWGDERAPAPRLSSVLETPSKIVRLDLSLNELTSVPHDGLAPFRNLRALDVSINQLRHFKGIEVLSHLYVLNLSHNNISRVEGLLNSHSLGELNLSNNNISDISGLPSLINLKMFNISNNKLKNLEGVSSFPRLEEVYANHNEISDLIPLTSCLRLRVINASHNHIKDLDSVLRLITRLSTLQSLNLMGNPVERDRTYQSDILRAGNIMTLDNISVRPMPPVVEDRKRHADNMHTLREAATQAFEERMRIARERRDENVNFLQKRIISVQQEYREFEAKLKSDLEACVRYLDTLSDEEMKDMSRTTIGAPKFRAGEDPDQPIATGLSHRHHERDSKEDYSNIKKTDEVLRCAFKELVKQRDKNLDL